MEKSDSNGQIIGGATDFYEIINEMDRALATYCGTTNSKKGMLLIYGSSLNSTVRVEMYANYSNRKNRDGRYNLIDFVIRLIDDENVIVETNTVTDAMELIAENINDERADKIDDEWAEILQEAEFISEHQMEMENTIEESEKAIKESIERVERTLDHIEDVDWWELDEDGIKDEIAGECRLISEKMNEISEARDKFVNDVSDYTGCCYGLGDAYCDIPGIDFPGYYCELDEFDAAEAFQDVLDDLFKRYEKEEADRMSGALDFKDTLYHYLIAA